MRMVEELLIRLMEKYLMMLKNTRELVMEVFSSSLELLMGMRTLSNGTYEYEESYCL